MPTIERILTPLRSKHDVKFLIPLARQLSSRLASVVEYVSVDPELVLAGELQEDRLKVLDSDEALKRRLLSLRTKDETSDLLLISTHTDDESLESFLDVETAALIEASPAPVVLVPAGHDLALPWSSILVPMSGEEKSSFALQTALELADWLDHPIDVIHVAPHITKQTQASMVDSFQDEAYRELPHRIEEFIAEASPYSSPRQKQRIRSFALSKGSVTQEVLKQIRKHPKALVAIEWKGTFMTGHAKTLKAILREALSPILLVRCPDPKKCVH